MYSTAKNTRRYMVFDGKKLALVLIALVLTTLIII